MRKIFVDYRETKKARAALGENAEVVTLTTGDYLIGNELYERKTASDLIKSTISGRLFRQLARMKEQEDFKCCLAITGSIKKALSRNPNMSINVVFGLLHSIAINFEMPIISFANDNDFFKYLLYISEKEETTSSSPPNPIKKSGKSLRKMQLESLCCIPSISYKRAEILLNCLGSLEKIAGASVEELKKCGLGKKSAENVHKFFR